MVEQPSDEQSSIAEQHRLEMKSKDERKSMQRKRFGIEEDTTQHADSFKVERVDTMKDSD